MKSKAILGCFVAMLVAVFAISAVLAGTLDIASTNVSINDDSIGSIVMSPGESTTVRVSFVSNEELSDAKVKIWISGYKDDIEASTSRFDVIADKTYIKKLDIVLPNVQDIEELDEDLTLHVEISDKNDEYEVDYPVTVQRESYVFDLLSVEATSKASAGDIIAVDVVLKNTGRKDLEDAFVTARIPELGIYKKAYFGDISPEDDDDDAEDAKEGRLYLVIPTDAKSGEYILEVKASNYDADAEAKKSITISGATTEAASVIDTTAKEKTGLSNSVIVLTVVLVIIFVVLLIVLVALLTRKPEEKIEDFGETSYY